MDSLQPKMNYYNTGFIGGFLYNLKVEAMDQPKGYSKEAISEITQKYQSWPRRKHCRAMSNQILCLS